MTAVKPTELIPAPMREITAETAADYLRESGRVADRAEIDVRELSGGVSNIVLRVDVRGRPPFVIKQCRERLRVAMDWRAPLDRIWTERATLDLLHSILPEGTVPTVLFEDRAEYLFAMTCAPDDAVTWKTQLMAGQIDPTSPRGWGRSWARSMPKPLDIRPCARPCLTQACSKSCGSILITAPPRVPIPTWPRTSMP